MQTATRHYIASNPAILEALPGKPHVWAVGERVHASLTDAGLPSVGLFAVPNSVKSVQRNPLQPTA